MAEAEKSDPLAVHFRAFVSYSHADAAIAQKLHRKIETYRLPQHLQADRIDNQDNGRLGRIFRDREDLPAAQDLSESVKQALAGSQVLVVICSPDARASIWVTREIELFRALHPDRPVLAALVRGEPEEAFPAALRNGAEPLAADLRKQGDGWRLGFLKIVAGIAGVPLDALVQRDAARRIRRVMAVTGGALVALLAMIGMTIYAIQSRNEAQHQQAEAEGLVEYMLTDLRTELKGVGRLDVMTKVNERAMDYYDDQADLSDMPAESLERRARILHAMGEDDEKRGDLDKALAKFTEAHRVTAALLARDPENPDRIFGHAQSEYWVGYVAYMQNKWMHASEFWGRYKLLADQLVAIDSSDLVWLREKGYADGNLCTLELRRSDNATPKVQYCQASLDAMEIVLERTPASKIAIQNVANRLGWLAEAKLKFNDSNGALRDYQNQEKLLESMFNEEQQNMDVADQWMRVLMTLGELHNDLGNFDSARSYTTRANRLASKLTKRDPENSKWGKWLVRTSSQMIEKGNKNGN
ncbi:MAG: tetratricopeptide (TPR) repeat protein [Parasphingorhabdus sp.]|uniref:toll/interleukin-1 receptor domain-containing protein n=1 Tax=Parasphingorhabdus sp. TaxID=2709688 RepID=UPI001B556A08|nr:toll/interleukin-1 receptor domain-containing protein [Sphingomonadales bacterium]